MSCERYILLLDEYLNNELEEKLHGSVSAHLDNCENCREEIRFLEAESGFYRKVETLRGENFTNQWEAMRHRLVAESLIKTEVLPERKEFENHSRLAFLSAFFVRLENLLLANKTAFGAFLLIVFGFVAVVLFTNNNNPTIDNELVASIEPEQTFKPEVAIDLPENNISQPEKPNETNEPKFINNSSSAGKNYQKSPAMADKKKNYLAGNSKKIEKLKLPIKPAESTANTNSSDVASRLPVKNSDSDFQTVADDKKLANHLNKVHLFLLMFRNLENAETIDAVIGDKYQTEAGMFLENNNSYKKESLKNKNIPAVELLNEIEPVLAAISNLDKQNGRDNIGNVTAMVRQTGIVFKMRLWMSNVKSGKENSL